MVHLEIVVAETAELLAGGAYGPGALLRWESSATIGGSYVEGGTVALVADVALYDVWDPAGTAGVTWYRWRLSDAGATTFGAYSAPLQEADHDVYLSSAQFRAFFPSSNLTDEALQVLLDAAAEAIDKEAGPLGDVVQRTRAVGPLVMLARVPSLIVSVVETYDHIGGRGDLTLDPDDYEITGRQTVRRLTTGPNPALRWYHPTITYTPVDDRADRQRVQRMLVGLEVNAHPGMSQQTIGTWSEQYRSTAGQTYQEERAEILGSLNDGGPVGR
jgi:hypothetical protein